MSGRFGSPRKAADKTPEQGFERPHCGRFFFAPDSGVEVRRLKDFGELPGLIALMDDFMVQSGRDMRETHAGLEINRSNFNALVEDLQIVMAKRGIPFRSQNKLLAKLAPMHHEIETR